MPWDAGSVKEALPTIGAMEGLLHYLASLFFRRGGEFRPLDFLSHKTCRTALERVATLGTSEVAFKGDLLMGNTDGAEMFLCRIRTSRGRLLVTCFFMNFRSW